MTTSKLLCRSCASAITCSACAMVIFEARDFAFELAWSSTLALADGDGRVAEARLDMPEGSRLSG